MPRECPSYLRMTEPHRVGTLSEGSPNTFRDSRGGGQDGTPGKASVPRSGLHGRMAQ